MAQWVDVDAASVIGPGEYRVVDVDGISVLVVNVDGTFRAIENVCTHDYSELAGGCIEGEEIICPHHGARFNLRTGEALTAPAYEPVDLLTVRVENEVVQVRDDRWD